MDLTTARKLMSLKVIGQQDNAHHYIIVGAGGTGARLALLVARILSPGDTVFVVDADQVEARNILRQHFTPADIGQSKAELVAARMQASLPATLSGEVTITGLPYTLQDAQQRGLLAVPHTPGGRGRRTVVLGCVDNPAARRYIMRADTHLVPREHWTVDNSDVSRFDWDVYIDAGNLLRNGQVCLNTIGLPVMVDAAALSHFPRALAWLNERVYGLTPTTLPPTLNMVLSFSGIRHYAPSLLTTTEHDVEVEGCGVRVDMQSAAVNAMAASVMFNMLTAVVDGLPLDSPFIEFSTAPCLMSSTPWPLPNPEHSHSWQSDRLPGPFAYLPRTDAPDAGGQ